MHFLVIPKHRDGLTQLSNSTEKNEPVLGHILHIASKVAKQGEDGAHSCMGGSLRGQDCHSLACLCHFAHYKDGNLGHLPAEGCEKGFRIVINDGPDGCEPSA